MSDCFVYFCITVHIHKCLAMLDPSYLKYSLREGEGKIEEKMVIQYYCHIGFRLYF